MIASDVIPTSRSAARPMRRRAVAWTAVPACGLLGLAGLLASCAGSASSAGPTVNRVPEGAAGPALGAPGTTTANLVGSRCKGGVCTCRKRDGDKREAEPPDADHKRFEIRIGAE